LRTYSSTFLALRASDRPTTPIRSWRPRGFIGTLECSPRDAVRRERVADHGQAIAAGLGTRADDQWLPGLVEGRAREHRPAMQRVPGLGDAAVEVRTLVGAPEIEDGNVAA